MVQDPTLQKGCEMSVDVSPLNPIPLGPRAEERIADALEELLALLREAFAKDVEATARREADRIRSGQKA